MEQLSQAKALLDSGAITEAEFAEIKSKALAPGRVALGDRSWSRSRAFAQRARRPRRAPESHAPWNAKAAREALSEAFGRPAGEAGCGGSIPLLRTLEKAAPGAEFVLWGPEDVAAARIHASDESVNPSEIEKMIIVTEALVLERLADGARVETG